MDIPKKIKSFFDKKKYWYFLPKKIRFLIWNLRFLKKFKTNTGYYYLPLFAVKDQIRNRIINNEITDKLIFDKLKKFIEPDTIVLDLGANFGQMSILWSQSKSNVKVYAFEASNYIFNLLQKNIHINSANVEAINALVGNESNKEQLIEESFLKEYSTYGTHKINKTQDTNKKKNYKIKAIKIDDINFEKKISAM